MGYCKSEQARANAVDCVVTALEGYMKARRPLPREGASHAGADRAVYRRS